MSFKPKSKWGKLLHKNDPSDKQFKLNEDVVDFLKPSTEKERIPGGGTRQLAGPRIDTSAATRWPDAADLKGAVGPETGFRSKSKRRKNLTVGFVRTPPEIIGEGGDESEVPVIEVSRAKVKLARSKTERRQVAPVLDTQAAESHRHANNYPMSAPAARRNNSMTDPTHPANHPFFDSPPPPPVPAHTSEVVEDAPRPGIKRAPTTFSNEDIDSPISEDDVPPLPPHLELPMTTIQPPDPPFSPPISENPELAKFLSDSPPQPRSLAPREAARQSIIRAEEGRVLRRLSRLDYDESADALDPRRPPSPNSPPRESRARDDQFVQPRPMIIPTTPPSEPDQEQEARSPSPEDAPAPIVLPHRTHPLPQVPGQSDSAASRAVVPPIQTRNIQPSHSSSHYATDSVHSTSSYGQRLPSDVLPSSSPVSARSNRSASLQPNNFSRPSQPSGSHPLPPTPSRGPSPSYFTQSLAPQSTNVNGLTPSQDAYGRSGPVTPTYRNISPPENVTGTAEHDALFDFGTRVAHMRGVFRLTAERERPIQSVTLRQWLRAAIWWLHKGRAGLTMLIRNAAKDGSRSELLTQAHVDVAKTWWILTDVLSSADSPHAKMDSPQDTLIRDMDIVRASLRSFTLSMSKNNVMPPHQSLIQGQDTTMWVEYPRFASDVASLLRGSPSKSLIADDQQEESNPLDALPLGDTRDTFCYSRMFVSASVNTEEADTDRVVLPCVLTMIRGRFDFQTSVIISTQVDLVNLTIRPSDGGSGKGPTWQDVSWKTRMHGLYIRLPRGFTLNIEFSEFDFRSLWNMIDYTNKIHSSMKPEVDERLVHETQLVEVAHTDSSNPHAFPKERVRSCSAFVFEKRLDHRTGLGQTKYHRGYRMVIIANPANKMLSMASIALCRGAPLLFETSSASEPPTMVINSQDSKRQCRSTLVFKSSHERQDLYDVLQGVTTGPQEQVTARVALRNLVMETTTGQEPIAGAFQGLKWKEIRVVSEANAEVGQDQGDMTLSEHFRLIALHDGGAVTDRLNLGKMFDIFLDELI